MKTSEDALKFQSIKNVNLPGCKLVIIEARDGYLGFVILVCLYKCLKCSTNAQFSPNFPTAL